MKTINIDGVTYIEKTNKLKLFFELFDNIVDDYLEVNNTPIKDKRNGEIYSELPCYSKHDFYGSHYGYLCLTRDNKVLYFYHTDERVEFSDVTEYFEFL